VKKLLPLLLCVFSLTVFPAEIRGKIVRVADGDTVTVLDALDGAPFRVRLDKIDAPELRQPFGPEAAAYLSALISGKEVVIRFRKIDRYGRIIATVYHGGRDVNLLMVRAGLAWHYAYFDDTPAYREAEKQARAARRGLWRQDNPVNPYEFRRQRKLNAK